MKKENNLHQLIHSLNGTIIDDDLEDLNENIPLQSQLHLLDEDMLLIDFKGNFTLHVGWFGDSEMVRSYAEYKGNGNFIVCVVHNWDWENVLQKIKCYTLDELKEAIKQSYRFIVNRDNHSGKSLSSYVGSSCASKYFPTINIKELELYIWHHGSKVTNGKNWKIFKFDSIIGAASGQETKCALVKCKNNKIHGHPIPECEYLELLKSTDESN